MSAHTRREYAECLGISFMAEGTFAEEYPQAGPEFLREFLREVRQGAARLYRGRRAHERATKDEAGLFGAQGAACP